MAGKCACAQTCNCCTTTSPSVGVVGTGSVGSCFTPEVRYSTDAGNRAKAGTDGAVFADTCVRGPDGEPIVPGEDGCVTLPSACIKNVGGDPIEPDEDGCVQLPANTPPAYGCGLDETEEGVLILDTPTAWPANDLWGVPFGGAISGSTAVFCMEDAGVRGVPEHTSFVTKVAGTLLSTPVDPPYYIDIPEGTAYTSPAGIPLTVVNPSPNRRLTVQASLVALVDAGAPPLSKVVARMEYRIDGGAWNTARELRFASIRLGGAGLIRDEKELTARVDDQLDPGDSMTFEVRVVVSNADDGDDAVATIQRALFGISVLGVTV